MQIEISEGVIARDLTADDIEAAGQLLQQYHQDALPDGYHDTTPLAAWTSVAAHAISWGGIAIGTYTNGGGLDAVVIASKVPQGYVLNALDGFEEHTAALLGLAKQQAAQRGAQIGRMVEVHRIDFVPIE